MVSIIRRTFNKPSIFLLHKPSERDIHLALAKKEKASSLKLSQILKKRGMDLKNVGDHLQHCTLHT